MQFFVDTAEIDEIKALKATGMVNGVTTNPSLILKSGRDIKEVTKEICDLLPGMPVSAEVTATEADKMIKEGEKLAQIADNVVIKLPLTFDGLQACRHFADQNVMTNVTLCFSPLQALLAAKAGATYVSPFVGRLDDIGQFGMDLIGQIVQIFANYQNLNTQVLVASIRHPAHILEAAQLGADVCTVPPNVLHQIVKHPLTDKGLQAFLDDWAKTGQSI